MDVAPPHIRVLQSFPGVSRTTNPYLARLVASVEPDVEILPFSWSTALVGRYDVLHLHWPENLLRGRPGIRSLARIGLVIALLARLTIRRTAVVRTLHNERAHESGGVVERALLTRLDRRTTLRIRLNDRTVVPAGAAVETILHGDFLPEIPRPEVRPVAGRLLTFGLVRRYKGIEELLGAFADLDDDALSLRVVGHPHDAALADELRTRAGSDARVALDLRYVDEGELAAELDAAELVVLPYRALHNSGALLLALSSRRPVLVPDTPVTRDLADEVGSGWVHRFTPPIDAAAIASALAASREPRAAAPDLSRRTWAEGGAAHVRAYRRAVDLSAGAGNPIRAAREGARR